MVPLLGSLLLLTNLLLRSGPARCMQADFCRPQRADDHPRARTAQAADGRVVFKLAAFGRDLYLRLTPDSGFMAPPERRASADLRECFYSGDVNADPDSFAALSLCGGLSGGFSYDGMEYFISPSGSERAAPGDPAEGTHVISRRRRVDAHSGGNLTSWCGVAAGSNFSVSLEKYRHLSELGGPGGPGRSKRFASVPRFVEVLLVADESMADAHGDDLEHYLLTLMSVVARLYRHPSILNPISVVVVGFMVMGEAHKGPKVSSNAALTLRNFCSWQKKLNKHSDKHPDYWDTAILFTKQVGVGVGWGWCEGGGVSAQGKIQLSA